MLEHELRKLAWAVVNATDSDDEREAIRKLQDFLKLTEHPLEEMEWTLEEDERGL